MPTTHDTSPAGLRAIDYRRRKPAGHDKVRAAALNVRRAPHPGSARWPTRGELAMKAVEGHNIDVAGWSECPGRLTDGAMAKRSKKNGGSVRVRRAAANYKDPRTGELVGNAISWGHDRTPEQMDLRLRGRATITSLPFLDAPHGLTELHQPVQLMLTKRGGLVAVIQVHAPTVPNIDAPKDVTSAKERRAYPKLVRETLCDDVIAVAKAFAEWGIPTVVVGDFNNMRGYLASHGLEVGAAIDVQGVLGYKVEFDGKGKALRKSAHPELDKITDHSGWCYADALIPFYDDGLPVPKIGEILAGLPRVA